MKTVFILNDVLNDICNLQLVIFGIAVTIFTVLYSFIIAKRDDAMVVSEQIKLGNDAPDIKQRVAFSVSYIKQWTKINAHVKTIVLLSALTYLIAIIAKNLIEKGSVLDFMVIALLALSLIIIVYISCLLAFIFKDYEKNIKI